MKSIFASKWLAVLMFTIMFLQSGHAFQTIVPRSTYILCLPAMIAALMIMVNRETNKQSVALWLFLLMAGTTMIAYMGSTLTFYIQMLITILAAYAFSELYSFETTANVYLKLMTVVSVVALIGYVCVNNTTVLNFLPQVDNMNGVTFAVGGIFNYIVAIPTRNCGMFWEPGMFATHLTIATVLELMTKEKASVLRLVLFSLCIFTANSSAGFALWFLCMVLLFVRKLGKNLWSYKTFFAVIAIIGAVIVVMNFDRILLETSLGENEYFQKLSLDSIFESSRGNAISHNLKMFFTDPIFGAGYTTVSRNIAYVADTSTSTYLMSVFGLLAISYTFFIVYGILKIKNINLLSRILIIIIALTIVNKEPHHMILFTWILIFYGVKGVKPLKTKSKSVYIK